MQSVKSQLENIQTPSITHLRSDQDFPLKLGDLLAIAVGDGKRVIDDCVQDRLH